VNDIRRKQLVLGLRIWLLGVTANTLLGTFIILVSGRYGFYDSDLIFCLLLLWFGAKIGAQGSLPAVLLLMLIIGRCVALRLSGVRIFCTALFSAVFMAAGAWGLFTCWMPLDRTDNIILLGLAIVSGLIATGSQYKSFLRLAQYEEQFETI
jgi:hypothetical protein